MGRSDSVESSFAEVLQIECRYFRRFLLITSFIAKYWSRTFVRLFDTEVDSGF